MSRVLAFIAALMALNACGERNAPGRAAYVPLAEAQRTYGVLITAGNHPTPDQHGTGERVGLFQDKDGEVWGLPLTVSTSGAVLTCAPRLVRAGKITDTFPAGSTIIGSTNEPTGWRAGTGELELMLRDARGKIRWQAVSGARLTSGPACWAPQSPGPPQQLYYYRLAPIPAF